MKKFVKFFLIFLGVSLIFLVGFFINENFGKKSSDFSQYVFSKKINWQKYPKKVIKLDGSYEIFSSGSYRFSGEIKDGLIFVDAGDADGKVRLIFDGVFVENKTGPAVYVKSADEVFVEISDGTENIFVDGREYDKKYLNADATIFSKGNLYFSGNGKMVVQGNFQNGIVGKDDIEISQGVFSIQARNNGISANDRLEIFGGNILIEKSFDGLEATNIKINDGKINIFSVDDGIDSSLLTEIYGGEIFVNGNKLEYSTFSK